MLALWIACWLCLALVLSVTTHLESGSIKVKRQGGLVFFRAGRFGGSFYVAKGGKS